MKTSELTGDALDWAVAICEGYTDLHKIEGRMPHEPQLGIFPPRREYGVMDLWELSFSSDWNKGGWIIERECIAISCIHTTGYTPDTWDAQHPQRVYAKGRTPLIAAMRCYVASKMGNEVEIPEELI